MIKQAQMVVKGQVRLVVAEQANNLRQHDVSSTATNDSSHSMQPET
jgi:hypothetical protein